jgi:hypothetical protein
MARLTMDEQAAERPASNETCTRLEAGDILYFPANPIPIEPEDRDFLLGQKQAHGSYHKNVSYRPNQDRLRGVDAADEAARWRAHGVMRDYSRRAVDFMARVFPRYARDWKVDFASFRPIEERGRKVSQRSRNDLLHVDNFPSRPSHGDRLLRIFTNINPTRPRVWITSDNFERLVYKYGAEVGLPQPPSPLSALRRQAVRTLAAAGLPVVDRPPYDEFMLRFHHFLKENDSFQRDCPKDRWEFPPDSTWICFTDTVSHACLSGQYMVEQTFIVRRGSLVDPQGAPISILERMAGFALDGTRQARSA